MRVLGAILTLFFVVIIKTGVLDANGTGDDSIEDVIMEGNQSQFAAIIFMKPKEKEETDEQHKDGKADPYDDEGDDEMETYGKDDTNMLPLELLRKTPWTGCLKKASKVCFKACKAAYKAACSYRTCEKRLKKTLKKECKRNCKSYFYEFYDR